MLRNVNSGAFQAYNIAFNSLTGSASLGAVRLDWHLGGLSATELNLSARAGNGRFCGGNGAGESLNATLLSTETSRQMLLTTPQHARSGQASNELREEKATPRCPLRVISRHANRR